MKKIAWKVAAVIVAIAAYVVLLIFISSNQSDYDVVISVEKEIYEFPTETEEEYIIPITIRNNANRMLSSAEGHDIYLSYHLYDANGKLLIYDNVRSTFDKAIFAKSKDEVELHVTPIEKGEYILGIDLVQEGVDWFSTKENIEKKIHLIIN